MISIEQALIGLGSAALAALSGAVAHLWSSLSSERKARLEDLARYTDQMINFRDRLREADGAEIKRLREQVEAEAADDPPKSRDAAVKRRTK